jgi:hypothetical protein
MKKTYAWVLVPFLALAFTAFAQMDTTDIAEKVSAAREANAQKARNYSWTRRTEVKLEGETKNLKTEIVRYTVDGELQKTPIDETSAKKPKGVRGKIAKKKAGEMKDWMADLGEVLKQYSLPTEGNLLDFLNKATVSPDGDGRKLDATDVVQPGDRMSIWIDSNHTMTRTEVSTQHDGSDVKLETDHDTTPDGLDYVARTMILVPDKGIEMTVENFSYQREH